MTSPARPVPPGVDATRPSQARACDCLALSHLATEAVPPLRMQTLIEAGIQDVGGKYPRTRAQVREIVAGLEMVPPCPGAQETVTWLGLGGCEDPEAADSDGSRWACCAVGRKP